MKITPDLLDQIESQEKMRNFSEQNPLVLELIDEIRRVARNREELMPRELKDTPDAIKARAYRARIKARDPAEYAARIERQNRHARGPLMGTRKPKTNRPKETAIPTPLTNTISKQLNTLRPRRTKPRGVTRRVEAATTAETPTPLQPQPEPAIVARNGPQWNTLPRAPLCTPYRQQPVMARIERGLLKPCWTKDF